MKLKTIASLLIAGGLVSPLAHATNGYFPIGYGAKTEGMGGAGIALPQDSLAAANNPAGMVMVGDRMDFGLIWFKPNRSTNISGNCLGAGCVQYNTNPLTNMGASGNLGINLAQLFIAPTWSKKLNPTNAVGVSLNLAYQMFSATGLGLFKPMSSSPNDLTDNGTDTSTGYGLRVGWTGEVTPTVTLGATYQSKTKMGKLSKYSGLFAEQGGFDIPSNFGVGIAVKATPATTVAFDVERTNYSDVPSVSNAFTALPSSPSTMFGASSAPGFGWQNINAYKLGVSYVYDPTLTLRAGFNHCDQPIPNNQTLLNMLAPGVVQDHLSLGGTWKLANKSELTVAYIHAFNQTVNGTNSIPTVPAGGLGGGNANITMHQDSISVSYGW